MARLFSTIRSHAKFLSIAVMSHPLQHPLMNLPSNNLLLLPPSLGMLYHVRGRRIEHEPPTFTQQHPHPSTRRYSTPLWSISVSPSALLSSRNSSSYSLRSIPSTTWWLWLMAWILRRNPCLRSLSRVVSFGGFCFRKGCGWIRELLQHGKSLPAHLKWNISYVALEHCNAWQQT